MISRLRRNRVTVGLDVGSSHVKAAAIDHSGAAPELARVACLPLRGDAIVEGEILDPSLVAETIRAALESLGAPARHVVTAIGGRDIMVKKIQMDRMPKEDAREVIRWEAEQYVPFDMESVQLDFQILDPAAEGLQMQVLLVAAKRDLVEQRLLLLQDAGITPGVVDVDAFALHNALQYNHPEASKGLVVLVNVGNEVASVIVQQEGVPLVSRDVPFGSRRLREELRRLHALSEEDAEAALLGRSARQEEFQPFFEAQAEELALGVERAVAFLGLDGTVETAPGCVYLSGGGARIPCLADAIAARLHARVEVANPLGRLRVRPEAVSLFPTEDLAPMLMLPVGLALRSAA
jgi:type IV pilus assembly protein PilM